MNGKLSPKIKSIQAAIFSPINLSDKLKVAQYIREGLNGILDGEPLIVPIPEDAPPEIPRIILKSKDGIYNCNVSTERIDLIFNEKSEPKLSLANAKKQILPLFRKLTEIAVDQKIANEINRLGLVFNFFIKLPKSGTKFLVETFLKQIPSGPPYETRIYFLYHDKIKNYEINKWIKISPLRKVKNKSDDTALSFIIDINTLSEMIEKYKFNKKAIDNFYNESISIVEEDLQKYFKTK